MRVSILIVSVVAGLFQPLFAQMFYVEASRNAIVRNQPDINAEPILRLERGDQLNAVTERQSDRFYNVFLPNGETGWVSSFVVRLRTGQAPDLPQVAVIPDIGGLTAREREYAQFHLAIGKPKGYREIIREGYAAGYDPKLKIPVWVQYRLTRARSADNRFPRTDAFEEDATVPPQARATLDDYAGFGGSYVRGHMAPAEDMRWSESAERQSNLLTNIAPQIGATFNGSIWKTIENRVRGWVMDRDDLTIICGPVFGAEPHVRQINRQPETERQRLNNVIGSSDVSVPTAFFKIVVDMRDQQNPNVLAFLVSHIETVPGPERRIENYLTSVDSIEVLTGLDFLTNLPDNLQANIEIAAAMRIW